MPLSLLVDNIIIEEDAQILSQEKGSTPKESPHVLIFWVNFIYNQLADKSLAVFNLWSAVFLPDSVFGKHRHYIDYCQACGGVVDEVNESVHMSEWDKRATICEYVVWQK